MTIMIVPSLSAAEPWLRLDGKQGPGQGKHVVLISGDEEYRSEEGLPQLAKILAERLGFTCTVLFAIDPSTGHINPNVNNNIPGLFHLASADLMLIMTRWRNLPDNQMKHIVDYLQSGRPVVGLRTATHAFKLSGGPYMKFSDGSKEPGFEGGFGKQVLGEQWVAHHGDHKKEGTRGILAEDQKGHPILRGIEPGSIFGTSDVYRVTLPLPGDSTPLVYGEVTETLQPDSKAVTGKRVRGKTEFDPNDPMMPIAWTKTYQLPGGEKGRVFTTTLGASHDLQWEGTRRLIVNGCLWAVGLEDKIPVKTDVTIVGTFEPLMYGFNAFKKGLTPADYAK
jgi:type 1 glutamine amidotransferase